METKMKKIPFDLERAKKGEFKVYSGQRFYPIPLDGIDGMYMVSKSGSILSLYNGKRILKVNSHKTGYNFVTFIVYGMKKSVSVHRIVAMSFLGKSTLHVDHINGIKSDNRIVNLRYVTSRQNSASYYLRQNKSSKFIGVYFNKRQKKFLSRIRINGNLIHLGSFLEERLAAKAYQKALKAMTN